MVCEAFEPSCQQVLGIVDKVLARACRIIVAGRAERQGHRQISLHRDLAKAKQDYD